MDSIELISICLATGSEVVSDLMFTVPIVFYDIGGHAITQHITCPIMTKLILWYIILGMDWLKTTNLVIDWVACSLELTVGAKSSTLYLLMPSELVLQI